MQTRNPILDEFAKLTTGAMGLAQAAGEEAKTAWRAQADRIAVEMDLVRRRRVRCSEGRDRRPARRDRDAEGRQDVGRKACGGNVHRWNSTRGRSRLSRICEQAYRSVNARDSRGRSSNRDF